jgi:hypothetical protein
VQVTEHGTLLDGLPDHLRSWMSHGDEVVGAPAGFTVNATSARATVAAFEDVERKLAGVQWHPEVLHSEHGQDVLEHFLVNIAGCRQTWTMVNIVEEQLERIREQVGDKRAICGLSGGVDSAVAAALVQRAIGDRLTCVFVDHGLLRKGEAEQVERDYVAATGVNLKVVDSAKRFLDALAGVSDPETKRKIIGREFIRVFEDAEREVVEEFGGEVGFWCRGRCTPTSSSPAAAKGPRTSRATTTWAGCPTTSCSPSSSRCAPCSRTRYAWWASSSGCRRRSCGAPLPGSRTGHPHHRRRRRAAAGDPARGRRDRPRGGHRVPGWTVTSGSSRWYCSLTYARSASRATGVRTGTRSSCGRSPARTR